MAIAVIIVAILFVASAALVVTGVYMLLGLPWALIGAGLLVFGAAVYLRTGLSPHG